MRNLVLAIITGLALLASQLPNGSAKADDFYHGKTINLFIGGAPGAGYDIYGRLIARHLGKHIPGQPLVVPRNMPGGGGRTAAAHLFKLASNDGLSFGLIRQELPVSEALGERMLFETAKFNWIGSPDTDIRVVVTWHASGVMSLEDAKKKEVTMGAVGPAGSSGYPVIINALLDTKFKIVQGYAGGGAVNLAMERREVDGRADNAWSSWKSANGDWLRDKKINLLVQVGLSKAPDLPDVPLLMDLGGNPEERAALKLISSSSSLGHPFIAPPGVPAERIQILRRAFDAIMSDPAFLEDAKRQGRPIDPVGGDQLQRIVQELLAAPQSVKDRANALLRNQ